MPQRHRASRWRRRKQRNLRERRRRRPQSGGSSRRRKPHCRPLLLPLHSRLPDHTLTSTRPIAERASRSLPCSASAVGGCHFGRLSFCSILLGLFRIPCERSPQNRLDPSLPAKPSVGRPSPPRVKSRPRRRGAEGRGTAFAGPSPSRFPSLPLRRAFRRSFHRGEPRGDLWELLLHPAFGDRRSLCKYLLGVLVGSLEVQRVPAHRARIHQDAAQQA